jgi:hypothetical protein
MTRSITANLVVEQQNTPAQRSDHACSATHSFDCCAQQQPQYNTLISAGAMQVQAQHFRHTLNICVSKSPEGEK